MKCLLVIDYFFPSALGGGPMHSVGNFISAQRDPEGIEVLTRDRDLSGERYSEADMLDQKGLFPCEIKYGAFLDIVKYIVKKRRLYDGIIFNSFFSIITICALPGLLSGDVNILLAPRGELMAGALKTRSRKKAVYLFLFKLFGAHRKITFLYTSTHERVEIMKIMGSRCKLKFFPTIPTDLGLIGRGEPKGDSVTIIFASRIVPKKNLDFIIEVLAKLEFSIDFGICGPREDEGYWAVCDRLIEQLPKNVRVTQYGLLSHAELSHQLSVADLFVLPSEAENFGHAIYEALSCGTPVLISDNVTLEFIQNDECCQSLSLNNKSAWVDAIQAWSGTSPEIRAMRRVRAREAFERVRDMMSKECDYASLIRMR